jgi:hypothetical protein
LGNCPFNPPQVCTFRHTHPCYSRHITFHFLILTVRIYSICLLYVFIVCCVLYVFTETQTVLYCVPTLNFLHIGNNYIIHVTPCTFLLLFLFPSLASSFFTPTPAHYVYMNMYMSPSPLCVLLTQCCDDVHSAGGGGRCCSGAGWDTTDAGWDTTARAGTPASVNPFYPTQHDRVSLKKGCIIKNTNFICLSLIDAASSETQLLVFTQKSPA